MIANNETMDIKYKGVKMNFKKDARDGLYYLLAPRVQQRIDRQLFVFETEEDDGYVLSNEDDKVPIENK